ncbi:hypothetical protein KCMC57_64740 (plasmid) [Kitasatospora sp. CMC57]|uniref:Uncharacterized protein n=1 Tax=Kitasatospora sp. CMC57 TaxID=3231513 RepID=A0AB33K3P4_9ACTN
MNHELTALERLLLEELPTGRVRDWNAHRPDISPEEAARNREELQRVISRPSMRTTTRSAA